MAFDPAEFRQGQRKMWSSGDWPAVAASIQPVADALVERVSAGAGSDVLDVGTGSGNAALAAAEQGASVTGLDITEELFDSARARAAEAGVEIEWIVGDAAEMPVEDRSFDFVLSVFGCIFAPQHQKAADELVRVSRPGGTIGVCGWTPEGTNGRMLKMMGELMPPRPPEIQSPVLWGVEDHVTSLFEGKDIELTLEREMAIWEWESAEAWQAYTEENLGPVIAARAFLEPQGKWDEVRAKLVEVYEEQSDGDQFKVQSEYLRTIARVGG